MALRLFILAAIVLREFFSFSTAVDTLTPGRSLTDGDTILSAGASFELGFFGDIGLRYVGIWYALIPVQTIVWVANQGQPLLTDDGTLSITGNGTLVITGENNTVVWSSGPRSAVRHPVAQLLDSGNFVVQGSVTGKGRGKGSLFALQWQSFDYPTNVMLPGMKLGWDLNSGKSFNLTSWQTPTDPAPGQYSLSIEPGGVPQMVLRAGAAAVWRGGPWLGNEFAGVPMMETYRGFNFTYVATGRAVYYFYHVLDPAIVTYLSVTGSGTTERLVWVNQTGTWNVFWRAPGDACDQTGYCGPFGICNSNRAPPCDCIRGFVPRSPANWALRDGHAGCVRETPLDCKNRTDGFLVIGGAKLPDTADAIRDGGMSPAQCRARCLLDCACTAYAAADTAGNGCLIWTSNLTDIRVYAYGGQDLYVRLAAADLDEDPLKRRRTTVALVIGLACGSLVAIISFVCIMLNRRKGRSATGSYTLGSHYQNIISGEEVELPMFDFDVIVSATDDFSFSNKLGEGGFGPVYKGKLGEGREIAIKRLAKVSLQGSDEFKNELMLIAKLQHRNLVKLLGCCVHGEERILIYEYMPNKSLDTFLFDRSNAILLDWQTRYEIVKGIARGLMYLHHDSIYRIIHRDLKAANILLDKDMNPKISDFGMARLFGGEETQVNTRRVVGTYGYMSPEYAMDGICSVKSDVYSFGVLTLEIVSGKRNRGLSFFEAEKNLLGYAWNSWKEQNIMKLIDSSMGFSLPMDEVARCVQIGLLCVQENPEDRPPMSSVILMLGSDDVPLPDPKQPGFLTTRMSLDIDLSISIQQMSTVNEIKVAKSDGR